MSEIWAERQRRTNQLVRGLAQKVLEGPIDGDRLYGLCRLTWITRSHEGENAAYIKGTKIPALGDALQRDFSGQTLGEIADYVATQLAMPALKALICSPTGFTNFYNAYRNSARGWLVEYATEITAIFRRAYLLESDADASQLGTDIAALPGIPKPNSPQSLMRPEYLLTPACFALDPRLRFPILNGAERVTTMLKQAGAAEQPISVKIQRLVSFIGKSGIRDAADLDQFGLAALDELGSTDGKPLRTLLLHQPDEGDEGKSLPLKDEEDVIRLQQALEATQRRKHNGMTNTLRHLLASWTLYEGNCKSCSYDVLVQNYDAANNDLLLEVKSSVETAQIRMAIGQVYDYWYQLKVKNGPKDSSKDRHKDALKDSSKDHHIAIVLPQEPDAETKKLLHWLEIGLLWFEGEALSTSTEWLEGFVGAVKGRVG